MKYFTAKKILDKAKDGKNYPDYIINQALKLTGDLNESYVAVRGEGVDFTAQTQYEGSGGKRSPWVVAQGVIRHSADSWSVGV